MKRASKRPAFFIGPAGWSYPDWNGIVYPARRPSDFDPLAYLACYFNLIEINSTFYRVPSPRTCESWARRVSRRPDFRFTAKAFNGLTHASNPATEREARAFRDAIQPLHEAKRLSAVLAQFPWSFRHGENAIRYIERLEEWLSPLPAAVEVRHGSWGNPEALDFFRARDLTLCGIDQPLIGHSLRRDRFFPGRCGAYFRLHGRNAKEWFKPENNRDQRYNYLYSDDEMKAVKEWTEGASEGSDVVHVVFNNHFEGQAVANAFELVALIRGRSVAAPPGIVAAFPRLRALLMADKPRGESGGAADRQPTLFQEDESDDRQSGEEQR